jgi:hypothetical protein
MKALLTLSPLPNFRPFSIRTLNMYWSTISNFFARTIASCFESSRALTLLQSGLETAHLPSDRFSTYIVTFAMMRTPQGFQGKFATKSSNNIFARK